MRNETAAKQPFFTNRTTFYYYSGNFRVRGHSRCLPRDDSEAVVARQAIVPSVGHVCAVPQQHIANKWG